ncbi:MAG TPA: Asp-tRNA(Asn)/Glu-tRNA(Gln) amidotransferase subunit GatB [Actinomycetota bacterium]|nr:Asp-tRNA(Asn)/Glu-tRNA(Gln) amidotransferase subunit GatB [Actinomycetota bacterium]
MTDTLTTRGYEAVIGLECHVELSTRTKMFCGCRNEFGAPPNTNVCPVCLGLPGSLPVPNERAIEYIVRIGLALNCRIAPHSLFHRKNYFYPDMPKDFQISQYDLPICVGGHLDVDVDGRARRIGITRVHMEEDTGKTSHLGGTGRIGRASAALVDYNRAGVPLVEVVSEPDLRSAEEARAYLVELRATLEALGVSDVRMEEGSLRCDANISVRPVGADTLGTKVEIKNLNSVRSLERALRFEQGRQVDALERGEPLLQETRHFDEDRGSTHTLRSKEEAFDYRYFPEPDLPPLEPIEAWVEEIRSSLPELPAARRQRLIHEHGLKAEQAAIVGGDRGATEYLERTVALGAPAGRVATWMTQDIAAYLNRTGKDWSELSKDFPPEALAELLARVERGELSSTGSKTAFGIAVGTGRLLEDVIRVEGLRRVSDTSQLEAWVDEAIAENPALVEQFRGGKTPVINALVGQVLRRSPSADPQAVMELLRARLSGS